MNITDEAMPGRELHAIADLAYMRELTQVANPERAIRMRAVRDQRDEELRAVSSALVTGESHRMVLAGLAQNLDETARALLLVELVESNPFNPHAIFFESDARHSALRGVAQTLGLSNEVADGVHEAWREVDGLHAGLHIGHAVLGVGVLVAAVGMTVVTAGGGIALLGTGAGAAALTSALATLGGLVGGGMAAGTFVIALGGAAVAASGLATLHVLLEQLPPETLMVEVRKAQIALAGVYGWDDASLRRQTRDGIGVIRDALELRLAQEESLSDRGTPPIERLADAVELTKRAERWVDDPKKTRLGIRLGQGKREGLETSKVLAETVRQKTKTATDSLRRRS